MPRGYDRVLERMATYGDRIALIEVDGRQVSYARLLKEVDHRRDELSQAGVRAGDVICLQADYNSDTIVDFFAIISLQCIVALLPPEGNDAAMKLARPRWLCADGNLRRLPEEYPDIYPQYAVLRKASRTGIVLFTSGVTGEAKAVLHDADRFVTRFADAAKPMVTVGFLLFDHVAGLDTALYTLSAGGSLVALRDRRTATVRATIKSTGAQVLPTSPSFLRLLCMGETEPIDDLSSLEIVTFGSEPIDEGTLSRISQLLPQARLIQKYGTSELGVVPARTMAGSGLWIEFDPTKVDIRIEDGLLWVRAATAMVGYLGETKPSVKDGWICTGDSVEENGRFLRIVGRRSQLINVGGRKLYPEEVEAVLRELPEVIEAAVFPEPHPILGQIVCATIRTTPDSDPTSLRSAVRRFCDERLERYKIPAKIGFTCEPLLGTRQKLVRRQA